MNSDKVTKIYPRETTPFNFSTEKTTFVSFALNESGSSSNYMDIAKIGQYPIQLYPPRSQEQKETPKVTYAQLKNEEEEKQVLSVSCDFLKVADSFTTSCLSIKISSLVYSKYRVDDWNRI